MAVKIRLMRIGKRKQPSFRVVVADSRSPRDGRFIEQIGRYDPRQEPSVVEIDNEKAVDWLEKGAQPSEAVRKLLEISGAWGRYQVKRGGVHVVEGSPKGAAAPGREPADAAGESPKADEPAGTAQEEDEV